MYFSMLDVYMRWTSIMACIMRIIRHEDTIFYTFAGHPVQHYTRIDNIDTKGTLR